MGPKNSSQQNKIENTFLNNESTIIQEDLKKIKWSIKIVDIYNFIIHIYFY